MAPVALDPNPSYIPLAVVILHGSVSMILSWIIGLGLYRSHQELGPSQETRQRAARRSKLTAIFGTLAALSLVLSVASKSSYLGLSYRVWASERAIELPTSLFGNSSSAFGSRNHTNLYLAQWLSDTPVYLDGQEIIAEKPRRLWWGSQLDLSTVSWTMLLSIEGRRRQIPFLWAYALLAQLVTLSFAQNLFYLALLMTPSPVAIPSSGFARLFNKVFPPKPSNWLLKPYLYTAVLALNYAAIFSLPYAAGTTWFPYAAWCTRGLSLMPLIVPAIVPESWGTAGVNHHDPYANISKLFRFMSSASALLHAKMTLTSFLYDLPGAFKHRHSIPIPFDTEKRSAWERSATALERILDATSDHPVVGAAGRDTLISALSLGLWAAVRAINADEILKSAVLFYGAQPTTSDTTQPRESDVHDLVSQPSRTLRRKDLGIRSRFSNISSFNEFSEEGTPTPAPRRRCRPRKAKHEPTPDPEEVPGDTTYEPTASEKASVVGDVITAEDSDWESTALAWGLTALGGLGVGSAGVFGAECISR